MNADAQVELMKLIIGYTVVGVFVFTAIATCLAMVNVIKFTDKSQYNILFKALIVEVVGLGIALFSGLINLNPTTAVQQIQRPLIKQNQSLETEKKQLSGTVATLNEHLERTKQDLVATTESYDKTKASLQAESSTNKSLSDKVNDLNQQLIMAAPTATPPVAAEILPKQMGTQRSGGTKPKP